MQSDSKHSKYQSPMDLNPSDIAEAGKYMASNSRVIDLEGVHNFRDYGGYSVSGGGNLRRGTLWRSGQHHGASDADVAQIAQLNLGAVFDLRFSIERDDHPCRRAPNFAAKLFYIDEVAEPVGEVKTAPHVAAAQSARGRDASEMREMMLRNYTTIAFRPTLAAAMRRYLHELAQDGSPSLIHCMAGKDRTGIAVAMLHRAVGVHRDDIMADYLLTNTAGDVEARIAAGAQVVQRRSREMGPDALRVLMSVEPEYLDTAFAAVIERYGSEDGYLAEELGADAALRDRLREKLVV